MRRDVAVVQQQFLILAVIEAQTVAGAHGHLVYFDLLAHVGVASQQLTIYGHHLPVQSKHVVRGRLQLFVLPDVIGIPEMKRRQ